MTIRVSVSKITTYRDCPRKYVFPHVWGIYTRDKNETRTAKDGSLMSAGNVFGHVTHGVMEAWLRDRDPFPEGWDRELHGKDADTIRWFLDQLIARGLIYRAPGALVEHEIWGVTEDPEQESDTVFSPHRTIWHGFVDWIPTPGVVVDWKTGRNRNYMRKTGKKLKLDPQMLLYAYAEDDRTYEELESSLTIRHIQLTRSPRSVDVVESEVSRLDAAVGFQALEATAADMTTTAAFAKALQPEQFERVAGPADERTCGKYGGCPYARVCEHEITIEELVASQLEKEEDSMDFMKQLREARKKKEPSEAQNQFMKDVKESIAEAFDSVNQTATVTVETTAGTKEVEAASPLEALALAQEELGPNETVTGTKEPEPPTAGLPDAKTKAAILEALNDLEAAGLPGAEPPVDLGPTPEAPGWTCRVTVDDPNSPDPAVVRRLSVIVASELDLARESGKLDVFAVRDFWQEHREELAARWLTGTRYLLYRSQLTPDEVAMLAALEATSFWSQLEA